MFDGGLSFCHAAPTAQQQKLHFECAFFRAVFFNINYEFLIFLNVSPHAFQRFPLMQFVSIWFRYFRKGGNRLNSEIKSTSQFEAR